MAKNRRPSTWIFEFCMEKYFVTTEYAITFIRLRGTFEVYWNWNIKKQGLERSEDAKRRYENIKKINRRQTNCRQKVWRTFNSRSLRDLTSENVSKRNGRKNPWILKRTYVLDFFWRTRLNLLNQLRHIVEVKSIFRLHQCNVRCETF